MKHFRIICVPFLSVLVALVYAAYANIEVKSNSADAYGGAISEDGTRVAYWEWVGTSTTRSRIVVEDSSGDICDCSGSFYKVSRPSISKDGKFVAFYAMASSTSGIQPYLCVVDFDTTPTPYDMWEDTAWATLFNGDDTWTMAPPAVSNDFDGYPFVAFEDKGDRPQGTEENCEEFLDIDDHQIWIWTGPQIGMDQLWLGTRKADGGKPCYGGREPSIWWGEDGEYVTVRLAYQSGSLDMPSYNGNLQIYTTDFVNNLFNNTTLQSTDGTNAGNDDSKSPDLNGNGLLIAFTTKATNFGLEYNSNFDVYIRDIPAATTFRAYLGNNTGGVTDGDCLNPKIAPTANSNGAHYVAFHSTSKEFYASGAVNYGNPQLLGPFVYVSNTNNGSTQMVSVGPPSRSGVITAKPGQLPWLSGGGTSCVFDSGATGIASGDNDGYNNVFRAYNGP